MEITEDEKKVMVKTWLESTSEQVWELADSIVKAPDFVLAAFDPTDIVKQLYKIANRMHL